MLQRSTIYYLLPIVLLAAGLLSCEKAIETDAPPTQLTNERVYASDANVTAAIAALYARLSNIDANLIAQAGAYTDELIYHSSNTQALEFAAGQLSPANTYVYNTWSDCYSTIYKANAVLEGIAASTSLSEAVRARAEGEARFLRGYSYFCLASLFGPVPLVTTTDVRQTSVAARADLPAVYAQILDDAKAAKGLLLPAYADEERVRATSWAATALLARTCLSTGKWAEAATEAGSIIESGQFELVAPASVFLKNSKEAIWQLWNQNGFSSLSSSFYTASGRPSYTLRPDLVNSFYAADGRKNSWITPRTVSGTTYYLASKYKATATNNANPEYTAYLRLAELLLVRAEALAQQDMPTEALADLNQVRTRAGIPVLTTPIAKNELVDSILAERRRELFIEGAHRFLDLKRSGTINAVMSALKPAWKPHAQLFPVPQRDRNTNPHLTQNPGY